MKAILIGVLAAAALFGSCEDLNIEALPVLELYKNQTCIWTNLGCISREEVLNNSNKGRL